MFHFFVSPENVSEKEILIVGSDVNHIKNVLRMKTGERFVANDGNGASYCCAVREIYDDRIVADIEDGQLMSNELPVRLVLFQGLPKADKLELIIQKGVELGVSEIYPVEMARCVVKLDDKKKKNKTARWQSISESAAKQSGRTVIPEIHEPVSFTDALKIAKDFDLLLVPYECADSMAALKDKLATVKENMTVGIFIGPEGGYEESEIEKAKSAGGEIVSLGKRILRTETASIATLAICMFNIESNLL
ncbi:MAG: 16S rRNA (uracil(1498)-N(3))-methyltransferase [Clostridia bacterium]|nr:16S rRNA (uracil(1498)-N(3))-methyltransferase [Clostridia bacterium]